MRVFSFVVGLANMGMGGHSKRGQRGRIRASRSRTDGCPSRRRDRLLQMVGVVTLAAPGERRRLRSKRVGSVVDRAVGSMVGCSEHGQMYGAGRRWIRHSTTLYWDGWEEISIKDDTWDIKG
jgi:hypothetical protein